MPDFDAIAIAVAARYAAAAITANGGPPAGYTNVRKSTADPPQQIGPLPTVIVYPDAGDFRMGTGMRAGEHRLLVRFYLNVARNLERESVALRRWLTFLVDQHKTALQLSGTVTAVRTLGYRLAILPYGSKSYAGIELSVQVVTDEPWSPTA